MDPVKAELARLQAEAEPSDPIESPRIGNWSDIQPEPCQQAASARKARTQASLDEGRAAILPRARSSVCGQSLRGHDTAVRSATGME